MFHALADPTRRSMIAALSTAPASVSDLARPFAMTLAAIVQHLRVLEDSGLVTTAKQGRVRTCTLNTKALRTAEDWMSDRRESWEQRLDRLAIALDEPSGHPF